MRAIIVLPYLFLLGCASPTVEVKSESQKIKNASSTAKSIKTYPMGSSKTKFEMELEQQKNVSAFREQNETSQGYSLDYLRYERDRKEEEYQKNNKARSESFAQKMQSLDSEYNSLEVMKNRDNLSNDEKKDIRNRMDQIDRDRNIERLSWISKWK
ncbi:hypothetical protein [Providencia sneebia]|uniref:Lipoprotein n=1 Tax=Providencia sneebia DSM 19967 TaxID=1141660 RepID=K8W834_9GAMM|nr:hypothetical protein [Providencia sneebia]EKT56011.1 hypothetical protein OO7_13619 [Providencia sneebia DSM 19967]